MSFALRSFRLAFALGATGLSALAGCSSPTPEEDRCGPSHATFHLVVDAAEGPVPGDVQIDVRYAGGQELYDALDPDGSLKVVFCEAERTGDAGVPADAGQDNRPIDRVFCELWTDGPATVRVRASGYPEVVRDIEPEWDDDCGLVLTEARITLEREPQR